MTNLNVGLHRGIPESTYHADPCERPSLSKTIACELLKKSPLHAWSAHPRLGGKARIASDEMNAGKLIDLLVLGGDWTANVVEIAADNFRTKAAQDARDAAAAAGKTPILSRAADEMRAKGERITAAIARAGVVFDGDSQVSAVWDKSGVLCRGRFDHFKPAAGEIWDLKTCEVANPRAIQSACLNFGYDVQHAAYVEAVETLAPELLGRVKMGFVFVERDAPHGVCVVNFAGSMRSLGKMKWDRAARIWGECLASGKFPGYEGITVEAPTWALDENMEGSANVPF